MLLGGFMKDGLWVEIKNFENIRAKNLIPSSLPQGVFRKIGVWSKKIEDEKESNLNFFEWKEKTFEVFLAFDHSAEKFIEVNIKFKLWNLIFVCGFHAKFKKI